MEIRRDQLAKMLALSVTSEDDSNVEFGGFGDLGETGLAKYVKFLGHNKISNGADGKYFPADSISRGQTAQLIYNLYRFLQNSANPLS
jgi:hypothetical protein